MRILLDTQVLVWYLNGDTSLSQRHRQYIVDAGNEIFVSAASLWELAVKSSTGKLKLSKSIADILGQLNRQMIEVLTIMPGHVLQVTTLPFHHRDPFDRMLIAQAQVEFTPVITYDKIFESYGLKLI